MCIFFWWSRHPAPAPPCWEWSSRQNAKVPFGFLGVWISLRGPLRRCHCPVASRSHRPVPRRGRVSGVTSHGISAIKNDSPGGFPGKKSEILKMSKILADHYKQPAIPNLAPILAVEHVDIDKHVYRSCHATKLFDGWETLSSSLAPHWIGNI